ncbi:MAG: ferrochelatase [Fuerstiella sp.]|nr:ferrochelatase [Fuerstiella sp.]
MTIDRYDALLVQSFGGPEHNDDVIPFLENVLRGRNVPRERLLEVAEHYRKFGGVSPINQQCRDLIDALRRELQTHQIDLPIYWGNRNWHPMLDTTFREMQQHGVKRVLSFVTSAFSSYSGCRQYREDVVRFRSAADADEIEVDKLRVFYNHPDFIQVVADSVQQAVEALDVNDIPVVAFTAHSIPGAMAAGCDYERQLRESCHLVAESLDLPSDKWALVYQSRSGRPQDPWLDPDICDFIETLHQRGVRNLVISPIGFISDHMEVLFDLDTEARNVCERLNINMRRASTPGVHPLFVGMVRKLFQERLSGADREAIGQFPPNHDVCPEDCCFSGRPS